MALMHIHRLTDNNTVVSLPQKKNQFLKFQNLRNTHVFQNVRNTILDNLVHHPQRLAPRSGLVRVQSASSQDRLPVKNLATRLIRTCSTEVSCFQCFDLDADDHQIYRVGPIEPKTTELENRKPSKYGNYSDFSLLSILHGKPLMVNTQTLLWILNK